MVGSNRTSSKNSSRHWWHFPDSWTKGQREAERVGCPDWKKKERASRSGIIWAKGFVKFFWSCSSQDTRCIENTSLKMFGHCFPPSLGTFMKFIFLLVLRPAAKALKAVLLANWSCWGNRTNKKLTVRHEHVLYRVWSNLCSWMVHAYREIIILLYVIHGCVLACYLQDDYGM